MIEYAWEVINKFEWQFLPKVFGDKFQKKFAFDGEYNLIKIDNTWFEVQVKKATQLEPDNKIMTRDNVKNGIIQTILDNFKNKEDVTLNDGVIYFKAYDWFYKIKIVKKLKSFNPDLIPAMLR